MPTIKFKLLFTQKKKKKSELLRLSLFLRRLIEVIKK